MKKSELRRIIREEISKLNEAYQKPKLQVARVTNRGHKYAIIAGSKVIAKFKTPELAKAALEKNRGYYEYWAGSVSVAVDNSPKNYVIIEQDAVDHLTESVLDMNAKFGGTNGASGMFFLGKRGLMKIAKLSQDHPDNVFMIRDDNYSGFASHYVQDGRFAKKTSANAMHDLQRSRARLPKIDSDVILKAIVVM